MKTKYLLLFAIPVLFAFGECDAQVILTTSPYHEDFNAIGSGLPLGWTVRTNATASTLGTSSTLVTAATSWNSATGNFRNVAAAAGLTSASTTTAQSGSVNRALALRQTGTFGDPGAGFVLQLNNTIGLKDFSLNLKLQSLDGSSTGRTVTWNVDYAIGSAPSNFTTLTTVPSTLTTTLSASGWGSTDMTASFGSALDNLAGNVWIRIVTLAASTGSSSRPTSAIDDFQLSYSSGDFTAPLFNPDYPGISNVTFSGFDLLASLNESGKIFYVIVNDGAAAPSPAQIKAGLNASDAQASSGFFDSQASVESRSTITQLSPETDYDVYVVAEDNAHNLQNSAVKLDVRTSVFVDISPPAFAVTYPRASPIFQSGFTMRTSLNERGKTYFVVLPGGSVAPTSMQVRNSMDANGVAVDANLKGVTNSVIPETEAAAQVTGLAPDTPYDIYVVAADNSDNLQVTPVLLSVTTLALGSKASQTIDFTIPGTRTFGDPPFHLTATCSSGLEVVYTSSDPSVAFIDAGLVTILKAGSITIAASQAGDENFDPAVEVVRTLVIDKASQLISVEPLVDKVFGDLPFQINATAGASGKPILYSSSNSAVATVSGNSIAIIGAGNAVIKASQEGNENFNAAPDVLQTLTVNKANQLITFDSLPVKSFGDSPFDAGAVGSSGLVLTYTSSKTTVANIAGGLVTIVGPGAANITASQGGNGNYNAAAEVSQTLTVNKGNQAIIFDPIAPRIFADAPFSLSATGGPSGLPVTYSSSKASVASISGNVVTIVAVGTTTITAKQAGNSNYNAATDVTQTLTINKAAQSITFAPVAAKTYGDAASNLVASGGGSGLPVTFVSSNTSVATVSGIVLTIIGAGSTTVTAKQAGNANYAAAADVVQTLNVAKASQTITFDPLPPKSFGDPSFSLTAKGGGSALAVAFIGSNSSVASVNGGTVSIVGVGSVVITASQGGSANYNPAVSVMQTLTVSKANQTILFPPIPERTMGDPSFGLSTPASSNLTVTYSSESDKVIVSGNQVTLLKAGRVTIAANQAGNGLFNSAPPVSQSFCIKPKTPVITMSTDSPDFVTLSSNSPSGNQWYLNGTLLPDAFNSTLVASGPGSYTLKVNVDECISSLSEVMPVIVTGDLAAKFVKIEAYPNPAVNYLELRGISKVAGAKLFDMSGCGQSIRLDRREETYRINVQGLEEGVYLLLIEDGTRVHHIRFIKNQDGKNMN